LHLQEREIIIIYNHIDVYQGIEIEEKKKLYSRSVKVVLVNILTRKAELYGFLVLIKEIYQTNICLLRKCVVEFRVFGKVDVEEIGVFCYGWFKLWM